MQQHDESKNKMVPSSRIEIAEPEWLVGKVEELEKILENRRGTKWKRSLRWFFERLFPLIITVGLAIGGYVFVAREDRVNAQRQVDRSQIESEIAQKKEAFGKVLRAVINMRDVREEIRMSCKNDPRLVNDNKFVFESNLHRYHSRIEVVKALVDVYFIFGSTLNTEISEFIQDEGNDQNVCSKNSPSDDELRAKQVYFENQMKTQIQSTQDELLALSR